MKVLLVIMLTFVLIQIQYINATGTGTIITNCLNYFENGNFEWVWKSGNDLASGISEFYSNNTMKTWDNYGNLTHSGTYQITQNGSWCYAYEVYNYPIEEIICKTFTIDATTDSLVGCMHDNSCYSTCSTNKQWETWSTARLRYRF